MIHGSGGQRHVGERRVLRGRRGHTGSVRHKDIFAGVELVPLIEQGGLWVAAHADPAHFMDIETRRLAGIFCLDVGEPGLR